MHALEMSFVLLIPLQDLFAKIIIADFANEFGFYTQPPDGYPGVCDRAAANDDAVAHIYHFARDENVRHLVHFSLDGKSGYQVKAGVTGGYDF
jgi:hypothetical protein